MGTISSGVGLISGLNIEDIVSQLIAIDSQPNVGTMVRVVLPLSDQPAAAAGSQETSRYPLGNRESILFIDDEDQLITLGRDLLTRLNYAVECFNDPVEAMQRFKASPETFDLVISDMTMPKMSGFSVVETVRRIRPGIPVVICSGYNEHLDEAKAAALGMQYIQKPIGMRQLSEVVKDAFSR